MTEKAMLALQKQITDAGIEHTYIGDLPELQMDCIAIRPVDGYPSTVYLGMPATLEPLVEVITRAQRYEVGQEMYNAALKATHNYANEEAGILQCVVTGSPGYLGRDTEGFGEWHFILHVSLSDY